MKFLMNDHAITSKSSNVTTPKNSFLNMQ